MWLRRRSSAPLRAVRDGDAGLDRRVQVLPLRHRCAPNRRALTSDQGDDPGAADTDESEPFRSGQPVVHLSHRQPACAATACRSGDSSIGAPCARRVSVSCLAISSRRSMRASTESSSMGVRVGMLPYASAATPRLRL